MEQLLDHLFAVRQHPATSGNSISYSSSHLNGSIALKIRHASYRQLRSQVGGS